MRKSFYTWLMAQRNPKSNEPVAILADLAFDGKCGIIVDIKIVKEGMNYTCYQNLKLQRHFFTRLQHFRFLLLATYMPMKLLTGQHVQ